MTSDEFNQDCIEKLKRFNFTSRVAVIGSGLSTHLVKRADSIADAMETPCGVKRQANEPTWLFFDRAHDNNSEEYFRIIKKEIGQTLPPLDERAYWHIVNIRFKSFVTLNHDDQMPRHFERARKDIKGLFSTYPGNSFTHLPSDLSNDQKPCLVAVHGYKSGENWHEKLILRDADYKQHYHRNQKNLNPFLYLWWNWLLTTLPCVFIGTSLKEPGLAQVIRDLIDRGIESSIQAHIHLIETESKSPDYTQIPEKSLGVIEQVLYDKVDDNYKGLEIVLAAFSKQPIDSPNPSYEPIIYTMENSLDFLKSHGGQSQKK